jgi:hypothetical protein
VTNSGTCSGELVVIPCRCVGGVLWWWWYCLCFCFGVCGGSGFRRRRSSSSGGGGGGGGGCGGEAAVVIVAVVHQVQLLGLAVDSAPSTSLIRSSSLRCCRTNQCSQIVCKVRVLVLRLAILVAPALCICGVAFPRAGSGLRVLRVYQEIRYFCCRVCVQRSITCQLHAPGEVVSMVF